MDGINYRAEVWVNGNLLSTIKGMFMQDYIDVTDFVKIDKANALAIKVYPVDVPGSAKPKSGVQWVSSTMVGTEISD